MFGTARSAFKFAAMASAAALSGVSLYRSSFSPQEASLKAHPVAMSKMAEFAVKVKTNEPQKWTAVQVNSDSLVMQKGAKRVVLNQDNPFYVFILGLHGCGKGTQGKLLSDFLGQAPAIATGDLFRDQARSKAQAYKAIIVKAEKEALSFFEKAEAEAVVLFGEKDTDEKKAFLETAKKKASAIVESAHKNVAEIKEKEEKEAQKRRKMGLFQDAETVIMPRLEKPDCAKKVVILDGWPRSQDQVSGALPLMKKAVVIHFDADRQTCEKRIAYRLTTAESKGATDKDPKAILDRAEKNAPGVFKALEESGIVVHHIDSSGSIEEVSGKVKTLVESALDKIHSRQSLS